MSSFNLGGSAIFRPMSGLSTPIYHGNFPPGSNSFMRLATGFAINRAADGPSRLITSESLRATLAALDAESRTMQRADSMTAVADGALGEISDLLHQAEALAVANANTAGMSEGEIQANQLEIDSIINSINSIAGSTSFNGASLLTGSATIAANGESLTIADSSAGALGSTEIDGDTFNLADVAAGGAIDTVDGDAGHALTVIRTAGTQVAMERGRLGAFSNSLSSSLASLAVQIENTAAAESAIRNTDYAAEISLFIMQETLNRASLFALDASLQHRNRVLTLLGDN